MYILPIFPVESKVRVHVISSTYYSSFRLFVRPEIRAAIASQFFPSCARTASFNCLSSSAVHLLARAVVGPTLETKVSCHLMRHCFFVRPETSAAIAFQFLPSYARTASFNCSSSSAVHFPARAVFGSKLATASHLLRHCSFVRPGISAAIAFQFLPPFSRTTTFNFLSSSAVHLLARAVVGPTLETKVSCHLLRHCFRVRPGNKRGNGVPILATVLSYPIPQLPVF
jgi:hypothetical protein